MSATAATMECPCAGICLGTGSGSGRARGGGDWHAVDTSVSDARRTLCGHDPMEVWRPDVEVTCPACLALLAFTRCLGCRWCVLNP